MKTKRVTVLAMAAVLMVSGSAFAHFGMLIPSKATVSKEAIGKYAMIEVFPSRQERLKVKVLSISFLIFRMASSTMGPQ